MTVSLTFPLLLKVTLTLLALAVSLSAGVKLSRSLYRALRVKADKTHPLEIVNQGNLACLYQLTVTSQTPALRFTLLENDLPLPPVYETVTEAIVSQPAQSAAPDASPSSAQSTAAPQETAAKIGAKTGAAAGFLGALGNLLPGSLGQKLKSVGGSMRQANTKARKAAAAPRVAQRKLEAVTRPGAQLGLQVPAAPGAAGVSAARPSAQEAAAPATVQHRTRQVPRRGAFQTRALNSGETLHLSLHIDASGKRYPRGSFSYRLQVQPQPLDKGFSAPPPLTQTGIVHFDPIPIWRYWLAPFSVLLTVAAACSAFALFVSLIWTLIQ